MSKSILDKIHEMLLFYDEQFLDMTLVFAVGFVIGMFVDGMIYGV